MSFAKLDGGRGSMWVAHHLHDVRVDFRRWDVAVLDQQVPECIGDGDGRVEPEVGVCC